MIQNSIFCSSAIVFILRATAVLNGQVIAVYDENSVNTSASNDYDTPGAVTVTSDSIIFDVTPPTSSDFISGGAATIFNTPIDFVPSQFQWEMRFRVLSENNIEAIGAVYEDEDPDLFKSELWIFIFDISNLSPSDGWFTLNLEFDDPLPFPTVGDAIQNPGMRSIGFVGAHATGDHLHVELDYLRIQLIPEPAVLFLTFPAVAWALCARQLRARLNAG